MGDAEIRPVPVDNGTNGPKSRGQELLDRFMVVAKRIDGSAHQLEAARAWIDGPGPAQAGPVSQPQPKPATKPTSFFEGMELIAVFLEKVADRQDKAVTGIKGLF